MIMKTGHIGFLFMLFLISALCFTTACADEAQYVIGNIQNIETSVGQYLTFSRSDYHFYPEGSTLGGKGIDSSAFRLGVGMNADFEKDVIYDWVSLDTVGIRFVNPGIYTACIWILDAKTDEGLCPSDNFSILVYDENGNLPELHPGIDLEPIPDTTIGSTIHVNWLDRDVIYPLQKTELTVSMDGSVVNTWNYDIGNVLDTFIAEEAGTYTVRVLSVDAKGTEVTAEVTFHVKDTWNGLTTQSVKVYSAPGGGKEVVTLKKGREVTVLGEKNGWYHISVDLGGKIKEGYVKKDQVQ